MRLIKGSAMNSLRRRRFLHLAAGAIALSAVSRLARAEAYPARPVHLIVGLPPGSAPDIVARLAGQWLSQRLGQPFVVDNRPGASTNIATEDVVRGPPDGYTLLLITAGNAINASLYQNLSFSFIRDIAPVAGIGRTPFAMVIHPSIPAKTVPEFIAYAKANPGKINMASPGVGGANHVFGEPFMMMTGVNLVHVPYRGSLFPDLLAGQVQVYFGAIPGVLADVQSGKLHALAVTTSTRVSVLPDVPTIGEFVPGYEASGWLGIGAAKGTSAEVIATLNKEIDAFGADADMKSRLVGLGVEPMSTTPDEFRKFIADETEKWAKVVKFAGIKAE
jgi:tripartite-type tricarboxylate transporter receptor subunit TctC